MPGTNRCIAYEVRASVVRVLTCKGLKVRSYRRDDPGCLLRVLPNHIDTAEHERSCAVHPTRFHGEPGEQRHERAAQRPRSNIDGAPFRFVEENRSLQGFEDGLEPTIEQRHHAARLAQRK